MISLDTLTRPMKPTAPYHGVATHPIPQRPGLLRVVDPESLKGFGNAPLDSETDMVSPIEESQHIPDMIFD